MPPSEAALPTDYLDSPKETLFDLMARALAAIMDGGDADDQVERTKLLSAVGQDHPSWLRAMANALKYSLNGGGSDQNALGQQLDGAITTYFRRTSRAQRSSSMLYIGQYDMYDLISVICICLVVSWIFYHVVAWIRILWIHENDSNEKKESPVTVGPFPSERFEI